MDGRRDHSRACSAADGCKPNRMSRKSGPAESRGDVQRWARRGHEDARRLRVVVPGEPPGLTPAVARALLRLLRNASHHPPAE